MLRNRINDQDRRQWAQNDEGLYNLQRTSGKGAHAWVRENRALIDEVIENVNSGKKPAHYLAYGGAA